MLKCERRKNHLITIERLFKLLTWKGYRYSYTYGTSSKVILRNPLSVELVKSKRKTLMVLHFTQITSFLIQKYPTKLYIMMSLDTLGVLKNSSYKFCTNFILFGWTENMLLLRQGMINGMLNWVLNAFDAYQNLSH